MSDSTDLSAKDRQRPPAWKPPRDQLLPARTRDLMEAAVAAASPPDRRNHYAGIVERLMPAIETFGDLAGDAWETLAGDTDAKHRFTERLRFLERNGSCDRSSADNGPWNLEEAQRLRERLAERQRRIPGEATVVPQDSAALLIMAAVHASQGDEAAIHRNLRVVLAELAGYDRLRPVLAEAGPALRDEERGAFTLRGVLDRIDRGLGRGPDAVPGVPWPLHPSDAELPGRQSELNRWATAVDSYLAWQNIFNQPAFIDKDVFYKITISPSSGCPGDTLVITAKGFGTKVGKVRYRVPPGKGQNDILSIGPSSHVDVDPKSWTDTKIEVVIPKFASCGRFAIRIPTGTATVNGKMITTFKDVGPIKIGGTLPEVLDLRADGVSGRVVTTRGSMVKINWMVCPNDATATINVKVNGSNLWTKSGLPPSGTDILPVGGVKTTDYRVKLVTKTKCGTASKEVVVTVHQRAKVHLEALEITQVTQFFWGGTSLEKAVNQVPLISGKPTLVRAYIGSSQDPSFNNGEITGAKVELRGWLQGGGELPGSPLQPINSGSLTATTDGVSSDRGDLARTANFLIPESWILPGPKYRFEARVTLPGNSLDAVDSKNQTAHIKGVRFHAARPLDVVLVRVDYTGKCGSKWPKCNGPPSMADAVKTLHAVRRIYPTDKLRIYLPETGDRILKYAGNKGCGNCGGFSCILDDLSDIAKDYDNEDHMVWWGAIKVGVAGTGGCGSDSKSGAHGFVTFRVTDEDTAWHEFGHAYGRDHTFDDSSYPKYGYADNYSVGEYGANLEKLTPWDPKTANKHLYSPSSASDFMSYDPDPLFVSPYTYVALMKAYFAKTASGSSVTTSLPGARYIPHREERLVICGTLWPKTGEVSLRPLYHISIFPKNGNGRTTRYELALVDREGRTLLAEKLRLQDDRANGKHDAPLPARLRISQSLPFDPETAALEVRDRTTVLHRVERPDNPPTVDRMEIEQADERWTLRWNCAHPDGAKLLHGVAVTYDDGERWQRLRKALLIPELEINPADLAGGERCRFRVYANDGFNTSYADSETFSLPIQPPLIVPLEPEDGATVDACSPVHLHVEAISPRFGSLDGEDIQWTSDLQGPLGTGPELWVALEQGEHQLTITAGSGSDSVAEAMIRVRALVSDR